MCNGIVRIKRANSTLEKFLNTFYIVRAPNILRNEVIDGAIIDGRPVPGKAEDFHVFGMTIAKMAEAYHNGYRVFMYNREDIPKLVQKLDEFLSVLREGMEGYNANTDKVKYNEVKAFAEHVLSLNKNFINGGLPIKRIASATARTAGGGSAKDIVNRHKEKKKQRLFNNRPGFYL